MRLLVHVHGRSYEVDVAEEAGRLIARCGGSRIPVTFDPHPAGLRAAFLGDRRIDFIAHRDGAAYVLSIEGASYEVQLCDPRAPREGRPRERARGAPADAVHAPIPGLITRVLVRPGEPVRKGQAIVCLDAMKLENEIAAPREGVLQRVEVRAGQPVEKGQLLFVVC